jgi:hypothetical protein
MDVERVRCAQSIENGRSEANDGWEAVQSEQRDDWHWGGFQLRWPECWDPTAPGAEDGVVAGFGYELDAWDVIVKCREALEPINEDDAVTL